MSPFASLLLVASLSLPTSTLVLRSGDRIALDGPVTVRERTVLFHSGGGLYSIPLEEVDLEASRSMSQSAALPVPNRGRLKVSADERERLLRDLEENHSGTPPPAGALELPPARSAAERKAESNEEWDWRQRARSYQEAFRQAQEALDLLHQKAERLRDRINTFFVLGYKPDQFTYDTTVLAYVEEQIPNAELRVRQAQRAYDQFLDDARRQDIPPGWLR